jgi:hypothetical protein
MMLPFTPRQIHALDELRRLWQFDALARGLGT